MTGTFSTVALLNCLGYEKARTVLFEMNPSERFKLAFDVATTALNDTDIDLTIDVVYSHLSHGEESVFPSPCCESQGRSHNLQDLSNMQLASIVSYLTPAETGSLLNDNRARCAAVAENCYHIGTLDHFGKSLSELEVESRSEIIDLIAEHNIDIANQLQIKFNGLIDLLELDYDELAAVLGGGPVEEIASALLESGRRYV
jgi:hypothetical protein